MELGKIDNRYGRLASQEATDELKKLIQEHPDYPIVVLVGEEGNSGEFYWQYATDIGVGIDEILDCNTPWWTSEYVCTDRDDFEDRCKDEIWEKLQEELGRKPTDDELEAAWKEVKEAHDPYWKKVISIKADN